MSKRLNKIGDILNRGLNPERLLMERQERELYRTTLASFNKHKKRASIGVYKNESAKTSTLDTQKIEILKSQREKMAQIMIKEEIDKRYGDSNEIVKSRHKIKKTMDEKMRSATQRKTPPGNRQRPTKRRDLERSFNRKAA